MSRFCYGFLNVKKSEECLQQRLIQISFDNYITPKEDQYHFNTWQTLIGLITGVALMNLKEEGTVEDAREDARESALGPIPGLVIAQPHLLELYSGHALLTELAASMTYLLKVLVLFHHLVWTLGRPSLQSRAAQFLQRYPPK